MTWDSVPWAVGGGAEHSPEVGRLLAYAATTGAEGVVEPGDLKVTPLATPGAQVRVFPGAALIRNRAAGMLQQTYVARNPTTDYVAVPQTSGSARSALVIARIEDPFLAGETWADPTDPKIGPYVFTRVIDNVPAGTTSLQDVPGYSGNSAVTLARIDRPANTATITPAMITDLRNVANPRNSRKLDISQVTTALTLENNAADTLFPPNQASIYIPSWATRLQALVTVHGISALNANPTSENKLRLGSTSAEFIYGQPTYLDIDQAAGAAQRISIVAGLDIAIPSYMRGKSQPLVLLGRRTNVSAGRFRVNSGAQVIYDVDLREVSE